MQSPLIRAISYPEFGKKSFFFPQMSLRRCMVMPVYSVSRELGIVASERSHGSRRHDHPRPYTITPRRADLHAGDGRAAVDARGRDLTAAHHGERAGSALKVSDRLIPACAARMRSASMTSMDAASSWPRAAQAGIN